MLSTRMFRGNPRDTELDPAAVVIIESLGDSALMIRVFFRLDLDPGRDNRAAHGESRARR